MTEQGQEGIVIRSVDGGVVKIKTEITIDAAVVGFTQKGRGGIAEILLALILIQHTPLEYSILVH